MLWMLTIIGMILHFNYHTADFMAGVAPPAASGAETTGRILIRTVFYHLPFLWIILTLYNSRRVVRMILLCISAGYFAAHLFHFISEVTKDSRSVSQSSLLFVVLVSAAILVKEHYNAVKIPAALASPDNEVRPAELPGLNKNL